ncbi:hypothetical protein I6N95_14955, partial [Vagococcus sp. BWB3-3]
MKKKISILIGVLVALILLGKTVISSAETSLLTKKDWQLEDQSINRIEVLNSPQELVVAIKQSQEMT